MDAYAESFFPAQEDVKGKSLAKAGLGEVLSFAMRIEKNAIQYYKKLRSLLSEEHAKIVEGIMEEEKKHYEKISRFRDGLKGGGK